MDKKSTVKTPWLGPLLYSDDVLADEMFKHIRERYPSLIGVWIDSLYQQQSYAEKCFISLRGLFETLSQVVGLICAGIYLQDQNDKTEDPLLHKSIHDQFARLSMPSTGTWIHLITKILDYYQDSSRRNTFPIPKLLDDIRSVVMPEKGYEYVLYKSSNNVIGRDKSYFDGRVLFVGVNLRNIIHHDKIRNHHIFEHIYPFYRDILLRTLRAFEFLDRDYFRLVRINREKGRIDELHGRWENSQPLSPNHPLYQQADDSILYLYDTERNRYLPLHPFFLQITNYWDKQREFMLASLSEQQAWFIGRNGLYRFQEESFKQIRQMLATKQIQLAAIDWNRLEPDRFIQLAWELTRESLDTYKRKEKYLSGAYLRRDSLETELQQFLTGVDKLAMIVWGEGGMGKSAWLCDIANRYVLTSEQSKNEGTPSILPLFINGGTVRPAPALQGLLEVLKKSFMVREDNSLRKIEDFFDKIDTLMNQHDEKMPKQVLLIVDAINESDTGSRFFTELYDLVKSCADATGRIRYPWLKIIYSTRPVNYHKGTAFGRQLSSLLPDESLFYRTNTEVDTTFDKWQVMPYVRVPPYKPTEMVEAFRLYAHSNQYNYLNRFDNSTLDRKIAPYQAVLTQPILLRFFTDLLNSNEGADPALGLNGHNLFQEYYHYLIGPIPTTYSHVAECMDRICQQMISQNRNFLLTDEIIKIRQLFNERGQKIVWYHNPIEELLHHRNVLGETQRLLVSAAGLPAQTITAYQFTYQKFGEYTFARYFEQCYGPVTPDLFYQLLTTACTLIEYNEGLVWYGTPLWESGRITELLYRAVPEPAERYFSVLTNLMLEEWVNLRNRNTTADVKAAHVDNWCDRMRKWVFQAKNPLLAESDFAVIFYKKAAAVLADWAELELAYDFIMVQLRGMFAALPIDETSAFFWIDEARRTTKAGQLYKAVKLYKQVQTALLQLPAQPQFEFTINHQVFLFHIHTSLGQLYQRMHNFDPARQELGLADDLATEIYHHSGAGEVQRALKAWALGNLSTYFKDMFDFSQALHYNQEQLIILELLDSTDYLPEQATAYYQRAQLFGLQKNRKERAACLPPMQLAIDRARVALPRSNRVRKLELAYNLLVAKTGDTTTADESLQKAETLFRQAGGMDTTDSDILEYGGQLAELRGGQADFSDEAITHFEQAIECWKKAETLIPGDWSVVLHRINALWQLAWAYKNAGSFFEAPTLQLEVKRLLQQVENKQALPMTAKVKLLEVYLNLCSSMSLFDNADKDSISKLVRNWLDQLVIKSDKLLNDLLLAMPSKDHLLLLQCDFQTVRASILYRREQIIPALKLTLEAIDQKKALQEKATIQEYRYALAIGLGVDHCQAGVIYGKRLAPQNIEEAELNFLKADNHLREGVIGLMEQYKFLTSQEVVSEQVIETLIYGLLALSTQEQIRRQRELAKKNIMLALSIIPQAGLGVSHEVRARWRVECLLALGDFYSEENPESTLECYQQAIDVQKSIMLRISWSYEQAMFLMVLYTWIMNFLLNSGRRSEVVEFCDREYQWVKEAFLFPKKQPWKTSNILVRIILLPLKQMKMKDLLYMSLELYREAALKEVDLRTNWKSRLLYRILFRKIFKLNRYR